MWQHSKSTTVNHTSDVCSPWPFSYSGTVTTMKLSDAVLISVSPLRHSYRMGRTRVSKIFTKKSYFLLPCSGDMCFSHIFLPRKIRCSRSKKKRNGQRKKEVLSSSVLQFTSAHQYQCSAMKLLSNISRDVNLALHLYNQNHTREHYTGYKGDDGC